MNKVSFNIKQMWEFIPDGLGYLASAVLAADVDNDSECEVIIGSYTYSIYCLRGSDGSLKWSYKLPENQYVGCNNISIADVDGDGFYELIFATEGKNPTLYVLKTDNNIKDRLLWSQPLSGAFLSMGLAVFKDVDCRYKILAITRGNNEYEGKVHLFYGKTGNMVWDTFGEEDCCSGPVITDLNGDGYLEFIYGNHCYLGTPYDGCVVCRRIKDGSIVWVYKTEVDPGANTMSTCDINNDKKPEIIVSYCKTSRAIVKCEWGTVALSGQGKEIWKTNIWAGQKVSIGNINGEKVIFGGGCEEEHRDLKCINAGNGNIRWTNGVESGIKGSPIAVDINNDGIDDVIVGDSDNNLLIFSGINGNFLFKEKYFTSKKVSERSKTGISHISFADVNNNGYWNILFNSLDGKTRCLSTNFKIMNN